jgi:L-iditol 2-dehydrogenase
VKALVLTEYKKFEIQDVAKPDYGANEVLVKIEACGICGSDVHGMDGSTGRRQPPMVMGHEASGTIDAMGSNVEGFEIGDRVTFDSTISCGECHYCQSGDINLCNKRRVVGVSCDEYKSAGAFAEYLVLPARILYKFGKNLGFAEACMVEPLSIAFHAVNITDIPLGASVVVIGTGVIGQMVLQTVRRSGCGLLVAVDLEDYRLAKAAKLGADYGLNSANVDVVEEVKKLTGGKMADIVFEAVGAEVTVRTGISCLRKGGAMTIIGNIVPDINFPLQEIVTRELKIQGSCGSSGEYPACLEFLERGLIDVSDSISAIEPMEVGQQMFDRLYNKEAGLNKIILQPGQ